MGTSLVEFRRVCEWCGNEFIAQKQTTRFCSKSCNSRNYKRMNRLETKEKVNIKTAEIIKNKPIAYLKDREFLKCTDVAKLLGTCRQTVYNLIYAKKLPAHRISARMTLIKRSDVDALLNFSTVYERQDKPEPKPIVDFYTLIDITDRYGVKTRRIWDIIRDKNIPTAKVGQKTLISQRHIDRHFRKNPPNKKHKYECNA